MLWVWTLVDGQSSDTLLPEDLSADELNDYDESRFRHYGETLRVLWTDPPESANLRQTHF